MIYSFWYIPESESIDLKCSMWEYGDEEFSIFFPVCTIQRVDEPEYIDNQSDRVTIEYRLILREADWYALFE